MLFLVYEDAAIKHDFNSLLPEIRQVISCVILTRLYFRYWNTSVAACCSFSTFLYATLKPAFSLLCLCYTYFSGQSILLPISEKSSSLRVALSFILFGLVTIFHGLRQAMLIRLLCGGFIFSFLLFCGIFFLFPWKHTCLTSSLMLKNILLKLCKYFLNIWLQSIKTNVETCLQNGKRIPACPLSLSKGMLRLAKIYSGLKVIKQLVLK